MKANNNPVLFNEKKICYESEERKANLLLNSLSKKFINKCIADKKKYKQIYICSNVNSVILFN